MTNEEAGGAPPTPDSSSSRPGKPLSLPWWLRVVPFFISAFFFLSAFFAVFSPLPILFLHFRNGRRWAWGAAITNSIIVGVAAGSVSLAVYLSFVIALGLGLPEFLKRRFSIEKSVLVTLVTMALTGAACILVYSQLRHINPLLEIRQQTSQLVETLAQSVSGGNWVGDVEEWKQNLMVEFPSAVAVFALVIVWANLVLLLRVNPSGVREGLGLDASYAKRWRAPEWLVWPTIAMGAFLLWDVGPASDVALNVFKFLMAIYAIQGLSILSFFFDLWNVRGFFRALGFMIAVFLMMPLLLSLGFFDLWFDFRSKFRQS